MSRHTLRIVSVALPLLLATSHAHAEWPLTRHDPQRTGASPGHANLARPVISWGRYVGGTLSQRQLTSMDVDGDGIVETLFISAGKLVAKHADDRLAWETPLLDFYSIDAVDDLNGDGEQDIVVAGSRILAVIGARDGRIEWRTNPATFGPGLGAIRVADFDGDGHDDLYVSDAACGSSGSHGDVAWAYHFGAGFGSGVEDDTTRLWQLQRGRDYNCGINDAVGDFTGDGHPDVVAFGNDQMYLFDGTTGLKIVPVGGGGANGSFQLGFALPYGSLKTTVADTDGDGRPEIIGLTNSRSSRSAFVIAFDPARLSDRLYVRWRADVVDVATDTHSFTGDAVSDLDGDGRPEIVSTFDVAGTGPTTYVYRSADGAVLATIPSVTVAGVFDPGGGTHPFVLASDASHALRGYTFASFAGAGGDAGPLPTPSPAWSIPGASPLRAYDARSERSGSVRDMSVSLPDRDGTHRAIGVLTSNAVQLWSVTGAVPTMIATHDLGGVAAIVVAPEQDVLVRGPGILLAQSDGFLLVLNNALEAVNLGTVEIPLPGVRIGGYYSGGCGGQFAPVSARDGAATAESLFVVDSRSRMLRLEAANANRIAPPIVRFTWNDAVSAALLDADGDGTLDVMALTAPRDSEFDYRVLEARRMDGTTVVWRSSIGSLPNEYLFPDIVPLAGATPADTWFTVQTFESGTDSVRSYAVNVSGTQIWSTDPSHTGGGSWLGGRGTPLDMNGDGRDDLFRGTNAYAWLIDGATGVRLGTVDQYIWAMGGIATRGRAGPIDFLMTATSGPVAGYSVQNGTTDPTARSLHREWGGPAMTTFTGCYGATMTCPDGLRLGNARADSAHLLTFDAATGTQRFDAVLAGGRLFASDLEADKSGVRPGTLGDVTAVASLTGAMGTPAFLVGSSDGFLYAIDPCTTSPTLLWSLDFRAPVGQAVFADYDGDGDEEIVVDAADGFVYGVDTERFPAPAWVYDTDPRGGVTDMDVDEVRGTLLGAAWADVPGATGYEWALFTSGGTAITRRPGDPGNPFIPVGAATTSATVDSTDGLVNGTRYFFAVRALGPAGSSAEVVSDGVLYTETHGGPEPTVDDAGAVDAGDASTPMDGGATDAGRADAGGGGDGGCACRVVGHRADARAWQAALAFIAFAIAIHLRRTRRRLAGGRPPRRGC